MNNTIILKKGYARLTNNEYQKFHRFDTIAGTNYIPTEIKRWTIDQIEEAKQGLAKHNCTYKRYNDNLIEIEEYMLEYCKCDEDGEFVEGSDYDFALIIDEVDN